MGIFDSMKQRGAEKRFAQSQEKFNTDLAVWNANEATLNEMLQNVDDCLAGKIDTVFVDRNDYGFMLKNDEIPMGLIQGVGYLEIVKAPAQYSAGYGGVSFPLFGNVRFNTGRIKGQRIPGVESMNMTDKGTAMITNKRIMFQGTLRTHEWKFDKMMGMSHLPGGITTFAMNTGKPAGIGYGDPVANDVQFRLEFAGALALGTLQRFRGELQVEKDKLLSEKPIPPAPLIRAD